MRHAVFVAMLALTACVPVPQQMYWVKSGADDQAVGRDLAECRKGAADAYVMWEIERPCMTGKGYTLSTTPPPA